jgi:4-hydroxybenzoate polyprenyltransferase
MPRMNAVLTVAWHCLLEARPTVQVVFQLRLLSGWTLAMMWPGHVSIRPLLVGIVAWFCVIMAIYLLNGVSDQREDRLNASRRPIARGWLAGSTARRVAWLLAGAGVLAGSVAAIPLGALALLGLVVGWLYSAPSWRLKRRSIGTVAVALTGMGITYYAGAVIAAAHAPGSPYLPQLGVELVVFAAALSLWAALIGGTTKDLPDVVGDRQVGTRSWVLVWGEQRFRRVVSVIAVLIGASFGVAAIRLAPVLLPVAAVLFAGALAVSALLLVPERFGKRAPYRAFMSTQYAAHLVLLTRQLTAMVW